MKSYASALLILSVSGCVGFSSGTHDCHLLSPSATVTYEEPFDRTRGHDALIAMGFQMQDTNAIFFSGEKDQLYVAGWPNETDPHAPWLLRVTHFGALPEVDCNADHSLRQANQVEEFKELAQPFLYTFNGHTGWLDTERRFEPGSIGIE